MEGLVGGLGLVALAGEVQLVGRRSTTFEIRSVMLHAITTRGFPAAIAAWQWMEEVFDSE